MWKMSLILLQLVQCALASTEYVNIGLSKVDLNAEIGIPLAGYGIKLRRLKHLDWTNKYPHSFMFRPSTGQRDPINAKTMVIEKNGKLVIFTSVDVIGINRHIIDDLLKMLKPFHISRDQIFVSGTHTHSGPGTVSKRFALNVIAVDMFKKENYEKVKFSIYLSIVKAIASLQPAELYKTSFHAKGIQRNKFRRKDENHFDDEAQFLLAKSKLSG